ncbi:hypothetical protein U875_07590 [Pandoraea pnomenusa 3kgm]|nr:hypothetical protein U875_07590 [Pandoraea pnomenusa 3kgm]
MLQRLEAMAVCTLLLERPDDALDHAVLLWTMRGDEFLAQAVAVRQRGVTAIGKDQSVVAVTCPRF